MLIHTPMYTYDTMQATCNYMSILMQPSWFFQKLGAALPVTSASYIILIHRNSLRDNGPIFILCKKLRSVVTSAAESETHGVFHSTKESIPIVYILTQMNHPQRQPTPIKSDNSTAVGFVNKNMQLKKSKTWDMQLHWLRDNENKSHFHVFWDKGKNQSADYWTKHHPTVYHRQIRMERKFVRDISDAFTSKVNAIFCKYLS